MPYFIATHDEPYAIEKNESHLPWLVRASLAMAGVHRLPRRGEASSSPPLAVILVSPYFKAAESHYKCVLSERHHHPHGLSSLGRFSSMHIETYITAAKDAIEKNESHLPWLVRASLAMVGVHRFPHRRGEASSSPPLAVILVRPTSKLPNVTSVSYRSDIIIITDNLHFGAFRSTASPTSPPVADICIYIEARLPPSSSTGSRQHPAPAATSPMSICVGTRTRRIPLDRDDAHCLVESHFHGLCALAFPW